MSTLSEDELEHQQRTRACGGGDSDVGVWIVWMTMVREGPLRTTQ